MFRINSSLSENDIVTIFITFNGNVIGKKSMTVDLTGMRVPTFSPNYYEYSNDEFTEFISQIQQDNICLFAFDSSEDTNMFDGITYGANKLLFTTSYGTTTNTIIIDINEDSKFLIISDLKALQHNLLLAIETRVKEADILECVEDDEDKEKDNK